MTKDVKKAPQQKAEKPPMVTVELVQRMIDASIIKLELTHGHLSREDADAQLASLTT